MAHRGYNPKPFKHGRTPTAEWTEVPDLPYDGETPDLPEMRGHQWTEIVEQWWEDVRLMPHCRLWQATDWQFAIETAFLKVAFWNDYLAGEVKSTLATEIRRREDQMGTTSEARRKLRIRYVPADQMLDDPAPTPAPQPPAGADDATVTSLSSRRSRLTA